MPKYRPAAIPSVSHLDVEATLRALPLDLCRLAPCGEPYWGLVVSGAPSSLFSVSRGSLQECLAALRPWVESTHAMLAAHPLLGGEDGNPAVEFTVSPSTTELYIDGLSVVYAGHLGMNGMRYAHALVWRPEQGCYEVWLTDEAYLRYAASEVASGLPWRPGEA